MKFHQPIRLEISQGVGESQNTVYAEMFTLFVKFNGSKSLNFTTDKGYQREDRYQFLFQPGYVYGHILTPQGQSVELTTGSRITLNNRYYVVDRVDPKYNKFGRVTEVVVNTLDAGRAPSANEIAEELVLDGQGVDHDIVKSPVSAGRGGVTAGGL